MVVPFGGAKEKSYKGIPKRNYHGALWVLSKKNRVLKAYNATTTISNPKEHLLVGYHGELKVNLFHNTRIIRDYTTPRGLKVTHSTTRNNSSNYPGFHANPGRSFSVRSFGGRTTTP